MSVARTMPIPPCSVCGGPITASAGQTFQVSRFQQDEPVRATCGNCYRRPVTRLLNGEIEMEPGAHYDLAVTSVEDGMVRMSVLVTHPSREVEYLATSLTLGHADFVDLAARVGGLGEMIRGQGPLAREPAGEA